MFRPRLTKRLQLDVRRIPSLFCEIVLDTFHLRQRERKLHSITDLKKFLLRGRPQIHFICLNVRSDFFE